MEKQLIIFLHGVGSRGADLAGLGKFWHSALPGAVFSAPDAPDHFSGSGGYQWFSLNGITEQNRPERIVAARPAFDAVIQQVCDAHGVDPQKDKLVLVGFSQGSIMALDALASGRWPLAGVVAFSGRLATEEIAAGHGTPVLLVHGQRDPVMPWQESEQAARRLTAAGFAAKTSFETTSGHTITSAGVEQAQHFLSAILA